MPSFPQSTPAKLAAWFMRRTTNSGVRRVVTLNAAVASDVGVVRQENQDRVALVRGTDRTGSTFILAVLADGIGGMKQGAECAALTLATFIYSVVTESQHGSEPISWLAHASACANKSVWNRYIGEGGSTLTAILLASDHKPVWLSIGDSRVYHAHNTKLHQLSRDDTLEGQLGKPILGGRRSEILQFVGIGDALEPHIEVVPSAADGTLLLTTDGVHFIEADFLARVIHNAPDLGLCAKRLIDLARMLGGPDNASVAVLSIEALQADPDAQLDDSCFEIWDPYGELQVMFDKGAVRSASVLLTPAVDPAPPLTPSPAPSAVVPERTLEQSHPDATPPGESPQPAAIGSRPTKGKPKKSKVVRKPRQQPPKDAKDEGQGEVPQLLIKFPNKAS